jgi:hypothetical protein
MHQPLASSSRPSLTSRPCPDTYLLPINSMCSAFGTSPRLTYSDVHSCLPSHAGSLDIRTPQDGSRTLAIIRASQDASATTVSETRRLRTTASPSRELITSNADHQSLRQSHDSKAFLPGVAQRHRISISSRLCQTVSSLSLSPRRHRVSFLDLTSQLFDLANPYSQPVPQTADRHPCPGRSTACTKLPEMPWALERRLGAKS